MRALCLTVAAAGLLSCCSGIQAAQILINAGPGLTGNAAALSAFQRAAHAWEVRIGNPITVNITADLRNLGSSTIIAEASSVLLEDTYTTVRDAVVGAAAAEGTDDAIVAFLPTAAQFDAHLPSGFTLSGNLTSTKANFKALGFTSLDALYGATDATIIFNSLFSFTYDNSHGVAPATIDFQSAATHELGHALGFDSGVDDVDVALHNGQTGAITPDILDLFRFNAGTAPVAASQFSTTARGLVPGGDEVTDQVLAPWGTLSAAMFRMSTGEFNGDGYQASHWKDDELTGVYIGVMNPTLTFGGMDLLTEADFRALDLIGYDILAVPEPGPLALAASGICGLIAWVLCRKGRQLHLKGRRPAV